MPLCYFFRVWDIMGICIKLSSLLGLVPPTVELIINCILSTPSLGNVTSEAGSILGDVWTFKVHNVLQSPYLHHLVLVGDVLHHRYDAQAVLVGASRTCDTNPNLNKWKKQDPFANMILRALLTRFR